PMRRCPVRIHVLRSGYLRSPTFPPDSPTVSEAELNWGSGRCAPLSSPRPGRTEAWVMRSMVRYREERSTMRLSRIIGVAVLTALCTTAARPVEAAKADPIVVDSVDLVGKTVSGTIAGAPFTTDITSFSVLPAAGTGKQCAILDLEL